MSQEEIDRAKREQKIDDILLTLTDKVESIFKSQEAYHISLDNRINPIFESIKTKNNRLFAVFIIVLGVLLTTVVTYKTGEQKDILEHKELAKRQNLNRAADWLKDIDTDERRVTLYYDMVCEPIQVTRGVETSFFIKHEAVYRGEHKMTSDGR